MDLKSLFHDDLNLHVGGVAAGGFLECLDAVRERKRARDERLDVEPPRCDQLDRTREHIGVTEHGLDPHFLDLDRDNIDWHSFLRHPDEDKATAGTQQVDYAGERFFIAAGFEHDVRAPTIGEFRHHVLYALVVNVHRRHALHAANQCQLFRHEITHDCTTASPRER